MTQEAAAAEERTPEERLLGRLITDIREGDIHRALQGIYGYRFDVMHERDDLKIRRVETVEWGVRHAPGDLLGVRWNPTYGGQREPVPYTEAEARDDSARSGYPVVRRTRVEYEIDDEVSTWEAADHGAEGGGGE